MIKIDLHTHSEASHDGGLNISQYKHALEDKLDCIAITDHNRIDFAQFAKQELGDRIIIGEEIKTTAGEIIGLFLTSKIAPFQSIETTIKEIKSQGGVVYIPHPFEKIRSGISELYLRAILDKIDIIEAINGRAYFDNRTKQATKFAREHGVSGASSSDSHGVHGWGETYSIITKKPTPQTLPILIANAQLVYTKPSIRTILYPRLNKFKKAIS